VLGPRDDALAVLGPRAGALAVLRPPTDALATRRPCADALATLPITDAAKAAISTGAAINIAPTRDVNTNTS
jgi:hypothetical protein